MEGSAKYYSMINFSKTLAETFTNKKLETNPETWYVNENILLMMKYFIPLIRSHKMLFND